MPLVSVLLPVWNAMPHLEWALDGLQRQRFRDYEIVAVDDGSDDGSGFFLEREARHGRHLRVIHTPHRGLPSALAAALEAASGIYIARHDADDVSSHRRLERQAGYLYGHPELAMVASRLAAFPRRRVSASMQRWLDWQNGLLEHEALARELLVDATFMHGTALFRREWLERAGGWRERGWPEDVDLSLRLVAAGGRLAKLPEVLYAWRRHPGSATRLDPRYGPERFAELRLDALARDFLARSGAVTLVGVGRSLEAWGARLAGRGLDVRAVAARRPPVNAPMRPPVVLVFGVPAVRERWRRWLAWRGWRERVEFIFVA